MDDKLLKVKVVFDKVREMRNEIGTLFEGLDGRITKLTEVYNEFIKSTKQIKTAGTNIFIFSLDSFYFQNNILKREYKYLKNYYNIIINRMYGEYYKLYKLIVEYVEKSHVDSKMSETLKNKKYPKYDDLNEEKQYEFQLIVQLNEDIINIVSHLINILRDKEHELKIYTANQEYGLNVNNFVSTFNYEVIVLKEQILLYEKYLDFFYHIHEKLLKRLTTKISLLEAQLNADIKFEGGLIGKRKDNNSLMNDMNVSGLNKRAARDLRRSIIGGKSPSNSSSDNNDDDNISAFDHIPPNSPVLNKETCETCIPNHNGSLVQNMFGMCENDEFDENILVHITDVKQKRWEDDQNQEEEDGEEDQEEEDQEQEEEDGEEDQEEEDQEQEDQVEEEEEDGEEENQDQVEEEEDQEQEEEENQEQEDQEEDQEQEDQEEDQEQEDQEEDQEQEEDDQENTQEQKQEMSAMLDNDKDSKLLENKSDITNNEIVRSVLDESIDTIVNVNIMNDDNNLNK